MAGCHTKRFNRRTVRRQAFIIARAAGSTSTLPPKAEQNLAQLLDMAIPHNSKCRYGERGTAAALPKCSIIHKVLSARAAASAVPQLGRWQSRKAGIVRCCLISMLSARHKISAAICLASCSTILRSRSAGFAAIRRCNSSRTRGILRAGMPMRAISSTLMGSTMLLSALPRNGCGLVPQTKR